MYASPGLNVDAVAHLVDFDVSGSQIFNDLEALWKLTNTANGNTKTCVELAVLDQDICRIGLC